MPEILPPSSESESRLALPESERQRKQTRNILLALLSSNLFEVFLWGISQFLSARGVLSVQASRIFLVITFAVGILIAWLIVWATRVRRKLVVVIVAAVLLAGIMLLLDRWAPKPALTSSSGNTTTETQKPKLSVSDPKMIVMNLSQSLEARKSEWWFWVEYTSGYGETVSPVAVALYLEISNTSEHPEAIKSYSVAISTEQCGWIYLSPIDLRNTQVFWTYEGLQKAPLLDFTVNGLNYLLVRPIAEHDSVGGWLFFDSKIKCDVRNGEYAQYKFTLRTYSGLEYEYTTPKMIIENRLGQPGSTIGSTRPMGLKVAGGFKDLTGFHRKLFSEPYTEKPEKLNGKKE